jgi:hypothetical protein
MLSSNAVIIDSITTESNVVGGSTTFTYSGSGGYQSSAYVSGGGTVGWSGTFTAVGLSTATAVAVVNTLTNTIISAPSSTERKTEEKIRSFSALPAGWHFGSGHAPSQEMVATAIQWHRHLIRLGFTVTDAFPGTNGEIMITAYEGARYIEILLETISTISLIQESDGKEVRCLDQATPDQVFRALGEIAGEIWNTSGYSIQSISTVNSASLIASRSRPLTAEHLLSSWHVSGTLASAGTYENIILTSGETHRYSGSLTMPSSPRIAA